MDELQMIREAYGEPEPPTLREMTEARAAMLGKPPRTRVRFGWRLKAGIGVVAIGAATAVAIAAVGSGSPAPPGGGVAGGGARGEVELGREAVLVAAQNAAKQETGKYWFSDGVSGQSYVVQAKTGSYVMAGAQTEALRWAGAKPGSASGGAWREIPARPQTPADAAAWKKAGSPKRVKVWSSDKWLVLNTAEGTAWEAEPSDPRGGGTWGGKGVPRMTTKDLQNLPADPKALTEKFLTDEAMRRNDPMKGRGHGPSVVGDFDTYMKLSVVGSLIANAPTPPKVRAGLMRAAAALPGVTSLGEATDPLGRKGVALASESRTVKGEDVSGDHPEWKGAYKARKELVFDKETGKVLASQYVLTGPGGPYKDRAPGFVIDYMAFRDIAWSDTKPEPPVELPF